MSERRYGVVQLSFTLTVCQSGNDNAVHWPTDWRCLWHCPRTSAGGTSCMAQACVRGAARITGPAHEARGRAFSAGGPCSPDEA